MAKSSGDHGWSDAGCSIVCIDSRKRSVWLSIMLTEVYDASCNGLDWAKVGIA